MSSEKHTFAPDAFAADNFACWTWRGGRIDHPYDVSITRVGPTGKSMSSIGPGGSTIARVGPASKTMVVPC